MKKYDVQIHYMRYLDKKGLHIYATTVTRLKGEWKCVVTDLTAKEAKHFVQTFKMKLTDTSHYSQIQKREFIFS